MNTLKRKLDLDRTQNNYKKVAWFYNLWSKLTESEATANAIYLADIENGDNVIEIACGTGLVFKEILKYNPDGKNLGIDLSNSMLKRARKLLKGIDSKKYELKQGSVLNLNIHDSSYDILINNFMLDLMPEEKFDFILSEFHRILKPNGVAVISVFSTGKKKVNKIWTWTAKYFPKLLTDCRPVEIKQNLIKSGFTIEAEVEVSQNTFPSKVYKVIKIQ